MKRPLICFGYQIAYLSQAPERIRIAKLVAGRDVTEHQVFGLGAQK